jgi:hypothetical protein
MRTYADFARRSPVPGRDDGKRTAPRNSPALVNASLPRAGGELFHFDGEFPSLEALVRGTLTGRNYGWQPRELRLAIAHIARVIRDDDGSGSLAASSGGAYAKVLAGVDPSIPEEFRLPPEFRIDVSQASDDEIVSEVARLVAAYVEQLVFQQDESGAFSGSPYDEFLRRNALPRAPRAGESPQQYTERLRRALAALRRPSFVQEGPFEFHPRNRVFGPRELRGLSIFLRTPAPGRSLSAKQIARGGIGNCSACHPAPNFSDFGFHNTGISQFEYDGIHGTGAFARLFIPSLPVRRAAPDRWLPATPAHPDAREPFRGVPLRGAPGRTDLGVWNVFANGDFPEVQARLERALCGQELARVGIAAPPARLSATLLLCSPYVLLPRTIARFKTPGLRDLGHSAPYTHSGGADSLEAVLSLYQRAAREARRGTLRNAAPELLGLALNAGDVETLAAFLRALDEDYR